MSDPLSITQDGRLLRIAFARAGCGVRDSMAEQLARAHETPDAVLLTSAGADFRAGRVRDAAGPASPEAYTRRDWDFRRLYRDPRDADPRGGGDRGARDGVWDLKQLRQQR